MRMSLSLSCYEYCIAYANWNDLPLFATLFAFSVTELVTDRVDDTLDLLEFTPFSSKLLIQFCVLS